MKEESYNPTTILLPRQVLARLPKDKIDSMSDWLVINETTELKIILSSVLNPFEDAIILDRTGIEWIYKPIEGSQENLYVQINRYEKDPLKLDLTVKSLINMIIVEPNKIKRITGLSS
jgi:hypothetical protein